MLKIKLNYQKNQNKKIYIKQYLQNLKLNNTEVDYYIGVYIEINIAL